MELRIVVTPKLLEEAVVCLMEAKFNTKITDSCIIIAESCNLTEVGGVTTILTMGEKDTSYNDLMTAAHATACEPVYEDDVRKAQNPEGLNPYFKPVTESDEWRRNREVPQHDEDLEDPETRHAVERKNAKARYAEDALKDNILPPEQLDEWQKTQQRLLRNMIGSNKLAQQTPYSS